MKQIGKEIQINNQGRETLDKKKKKLIVCQLFVRFHSSLSFRPFISMFLVFDFYHGESSQYRSVKLSCQGESVLDQILLQLPNLFELFFQVSLKAFFFTGGFDPRKTKTALLVPLNKCLRCSIQIFHVENTYLHATCNRWS